MQIFLRSFLHLLTVKLHFLISYSWNDFIFSSLIPSVYKVLFIFLHQEGFVNYVLHWYVRFSHQFRIQFIRLLLSILLHEYHLNSIIKTRAINVNCCPQHTELWFDKYLFAHVMLLGCDNIQLFILLPKFYLSGVARVKIINSSIQVQIMWDRKFEDRSLKSVT